MDERPLSPAGVRRGTRELAGRLVREDHLPLIDVGLALRLQCPPPKAPDPSCVGEGCAAVAPPRWTGKHSRCGFLLDDRHPTLAGHRAIAQRLLDAYPRRRQQAAGGG